MVLKKNKRITVLILLLFLVVIITTVFFITDNRALKNSSLMDMMYGEVISVTDDTIV